MFAHATRIKYFDAARSETGWPSHSLLARSPEGRWGLYAAEPIAEGTYLFQLGGAMTDASDSVRAGALLSYRGTRCEPSEYPSVSTRSTRAAARPATLASGGGALRWYTAGSFAVR